MNRHKPSKINQLLRSWPRGTVGVQKWLEKKGVYRQLIDTYVKGSWLERIGEGAYIQSGDSADWKGGLYALQDELEMPVHIGGLTSLELQGLAHFIPMNKKQAAWLFKDPKEKRDFPLWFKKYFSKEVRFKFITRKLFIDNSIGLAEKQFGEYHIRLSTPERAILECLDLVPYFFSLEHCILLIEGLTTLRPHLLQSLLQSCISIKVKRLFMVLAEKENHAWKNKLDVLKINFGRGKRVIGKGGKFISKYNLSIPDVDIQEGYKSYDQ